MITVAIKKLKKTVRVVCPWLAWAYGKYHNCALFVERWAHLLFMQCNISRTIRNLSRKEKIRVAIVVVFDSVFQFKRLFELMCEDDRLDPYIVVAPAMNRTQKEREQFLREAVETLSKEYGSRVIDSRVENGYMDIVGKFDLCITNNSYDGLTHQNFGIEYLSRHGIPVVTANYGYDGGTRYTKFYVSMSQFAYLWRYYAGTNYLKKGLDGAQVLLWLFRRVKLSGVPKMDLLAEQVCRPRKRKRIIICPHHSIEGSSLLSLSNFCTYSDFILSLPSRYPMIDWVFRPHPLLPSSLKNFAGWNDQMWNAYIARFCAHTNAVYVPNGDCFDMFVNSDGMIQDCSSFLAEYHCTGHPQCYVLRDHTQASKQFVSWGLELLSHTYQAFSEADIIGFIENVVLKGYDTKKDSRERFVNEKMRFNYPNVSQWILSEIKKSIWGEYVIE